METTRHNIGDNMEAMLVRGRPISPMAKANNRSKRKTRNYDHAFSAAAAFEPVVPTGVELRNVVY